MFIAANIVGCRLRHQDARSSVNSLLSQFCKTSLFFFFFFANFYVCGGGRQLFALPWLSHGQRPALTTILLDTWNWKPLPHMPNSPSLVLSVKLDKYLEYQGCICEEKKNIKTDFLA
jgi:hypothetical protein